MITITARCQTCAWTWKPRKAEGPALDLDRARRAADAHARANAGHTVASKAFNVERRGARGFVRMLDVEITRG